mgnify:CR=1 FL=1
MSSLRNAIPCGRPAQLAGGPRTFSCWAASSAATAHNVPCIPTSQNHRASDITSIMSPCELNAACALDACLQHGLVCDDISCRFKRVFASHLPACLLVDRQIFSHHLSNIIHRAYLAQHKYGWCASTTFWPSATAARGKLAESDEHAALPNVLGCNGPPHPALPQTKNALSLP